MTTSYGYCPNGGLWYTCASQTPTFFGCCTSDPCNGSGCPTSDLRAAGMGVGSGFDGSTYANDSSYYPNVNCATGDWYTCAAASPSFQGCCNRTNPCSTGSCPQNSLFPAAFSDVQARTDTDVVCKNGKWYSCVAQNPPFQGCCLSNPCTGDGGTCDSSQVFDVVSIVKTGTVSYIGRTSSISASASGSASNLLTMTQSSSQTTSAASATTTAVTTPLPSLSPGPNIAVIAGASAGGAFAAILVIFAIVYFVRKSLKKRRVLSGTNIAISGPPDSPGTPFKDKPYYSGYPSPDAQKYGALSLGPPAYQSPQRSPNTNIRDTFVSEADSTVIHEVGDGQSPALTAGGFTPSSVHSGFQRMSGGGARGHSGADYGLGLGSNQDHIAELPHGSY